MKKIITILSLLLSAFIANAQGYPVPQSIGSDSTIVTSKGAFRSRIVNTIFFDTTSANQQRIKYYYGAQVVTTSGGLRFWLRDSVNNKWTEIVSGAASGVTSVALTMPSAFSVAGSPITGAGTFVITGAGTTAQYIRGDGTLATFPSSVVAWGSITGTLSNQTDLQAALDLKANLASPTFTGTPTLPTGTIGVTQSAGNSTTALATTAFVTTADNLKANIASPTFTGTVTFPSPFTLGATSVTASGIELNFVDGVTSNIQTQLDGKQPIITLTTTGTSGASTLVGNTLNIPQYSGGGGYDSAYKRIIQPNDSTLIFQRYNNGQDSIVFNTGGGGGADSLGSYIVQTATNAPANAQILASLATGIVKNTTTTGVLSIAVAGDFPTLNQNTTGSAATLTTSRNIQGIAFNGSSSIDIINGTGFVKSTGTTLSYDNSTYLTTASAASTYAPLASPTLTGVPAAPTAASGTNTTQIATTAFVLAAAQDAIDDNPIYFDATDFDGTGTVGDPITIAGGGGAVSSITGTANQIAASAATGAVTLSIPSVFSAPGTITAATGFTVTTGGATVTAGGLTITAGGALITAGGLTVTAGTTTLTPLNTIGLVFNSAAGVLSSYAATDHGLQIGNATGQIASLGLGTTGQVLTSNGAGFDPSWQAGGSGDMVLADVQTVTGAKTYNDTKLLLRNVAGTFNGSFVNTNTADRIYTLPDFNGTLSTLAGTETLTNKRWTARVGSTTSSATPTINTDNTDIYKITAQTEAITSFTTNLSGTPVDGDILEIQVTGTAARAITWGASFVSSTVTLPTTTVTTATLTVILQYFTTSSYGNTKWVCVNSF